PSSTRPSSATRLCSPTAIAGSLAVYPSTLTRPAAISASAERREATPAWARYLASRNESIRGRGPCAATIGARAPATLAVGDAVCGQLEARGLTPARALRRFRSTAALLCFALGAGA